MTERIDIRLPDERFHRHTLIPWWDQKRLASATALVLGVGALGNEIVKNLCLLGIGVGCHVPAPHRGAYCQGYLRSLG